MRVVMRSIRPDFSAIGMKLAGGARAGYCGGRQCFGRLYRLQPRGNFLDPSGASQPRRAFDAVGHTPCLRRAMGRSDHACDVLPRATSVA